MNLQWTSVDPRQSVTLPDPWQYLEQSEFPPLIFERVRRFAINEERQGRGEQAWEFLKTLGRSYLPGAFQASRFEIPKDNSLIRGIQTRHLSAVSELAAQWGNIIPAIFWDTLASVGVRPDPTQEDSILNIQPWLLHPWYICDAALHAFGINYPFFFHVQSYLARRNEGHVLFHSCGCDHQLAGMEKIVFDYEIPPEKRLKAAKDFLDHFLGQMILITVEGYPFVMNPEAMESLQVMSLQPLGLANEKA